MLPNPSSSNELLKEIDSWKVSPFNDASIPKSCEILKNVESNIYLINVTEGWNT